MHLQQLPSRGGGGNFFLIVNIIAVVLKWKLYQSELWQVPGRIEKRKKSRENSPVTPMEQGRASGKTHPVVFAMFMYDTVHQNKLQVTLVRGKLLDIKTMAYTGIV